MVLPSGVTRLAGSDTTDPAGLRGTVSVPEIRGVTTIANVAMQNRGVFGQVVSPDADDRTDPMTSPRQAFTSLTDSWRHAAADGAADSGFWNAVAGSAVGSGPR